MIIEPEVGGISIVLVGGFNPTIFQPIWFSNVGLFDKQAVDAAIIQIVMPDVASFQIGTMTFQVDQERFIIQTTQAPWIESADLIARLFGELLPHTPVKLVGVNRHVHFRVASEKVRNSIGRMLAPIAPWGEWGKLIDGKTGDLRSGFVSLVMQETWRKAGFQGHIQSNIQPSKLIGQNGIFMQVNHQMERAPFSDGPEPNLIQYMHDNFDASIKNSEAIISEIMALKDRV